MSKIRDVLVSVVLVGYSLLAAASCAQPNKNVPVIGVSLNYSDWTALNDPNPVIAGVRYLQLVATVLPANASNKKVIWAISSAPTSYSVQPAVSSTGLVSYPDIGTNNLTVTATTEDGGFTATCTGNASCPLVFVGDGTGKFSYLTDLQGPIIGMPSSNGLASRTALFTEDYVVLDGLKPDPSGDYQVKLRETQAEITYLDELKLVPVDIPDGYDLASSSSAHTYINGYVTPHQYQTFKMPRAPVSAVDWSGKDVTEALKATDGVPASIDTDAPYYDLDFGTFDAKHAKLILVGWALYSEMYTSKSFIPATVAVKNATGEWTPIKTFGVTAGDEKTMVIDLSGLFPTNDHHLRLNVGSRPWVKWVIDSVSLDDSAPAELVVGDEVLPQSASLSQGGLASMQLSSVHARTTVMDDNIAFNGVGLGKGRFTRYGEVLELLTKSDDQFVILGMGDQVLMTFHPVSQPKPGFHRVMVLKVQQYYKAPYVELNVTPLPFKGMTAYPYPVSESYPSDAAHQAYLAKYNTRLN